MAGEVPSKTGLAHRWLRQRALFAELRTLEKSESGGRSSGGETSANEASRSEIRRAETSRTGTGRVENDWAEISREEILRVSAGKCEISRGKLVSLRLKPAQEALLNETLACSCYQNQSSYLRATATGRDRRAPIIAKAGMLFFWTWAYFGEEIYFRDGSLGEDGLGEGNLGDGKDGKSAGCERTAGKEEGQEALQALSRFLFGLGKVGEALAVIRRHLRAAQLSTENKLEKKGPAKGGPGGQLPPVPGAVQRRLDDSPGPTASIRFCEERKRLIEENVSYSAFDNKSAYIRHMALGWDRNARVRAQCATIAEWMIDCLAQGSCMKDSSAEGHREETCGGWVGPRDWRQLDEAMQRRFGVFLSGPGPTGGTDVEGVLREGTKHLLGAAPETIAARVPAKI